ncbi:MAG: S8 family serine peptidase, partial [Ferruginibacter sp.]
MYLKVVDTHEHSLNNVEIEISSNSDPQIVYTPGYSEEKNLFEMNDLPPGIYKLHVSCEGYVNATRTIEHHLTDEKKIYKIILGRTGSKFLTFGGRSLPLEHPVEELLIMNPEVSRLKSVDSKTNSFNFLKIKQAESDEVGVIKLQIPQKKADREVVKSRLSIPNLPAGLLIINRDNENRELMIGALSILHCHDTVTDERIDEILVEYNLSRQSDITLTAQNTKKVIAIYTEMLSWEYVESLNTISDLEDVVTIQPQLSMKVEHCYVPSDYLFPSQWSLPVANVQDAWELLFKVDKQIGYGSADLIVNVFDTGIQSNILGGPDIKAVNKDLDQAVDGGDLTKLLDTQNPPHLGKQHKIYHINNVTTTLVPPAPGIRKYNLIVADNDVLTDNNSHGTCCAGIIAAAGAIDLAFPGNGIKDNGGITGVSPNVRLMSTRWDFKLFFPGTEQIFNYMSGMNPGWLLGNHTGVVFPIQFNSPHNLGPGYTISNHSHSWPAGLGLSFGELEPFTIFINTLVSYGRNRRGGFILFAATNFGRKIDIDMVVGKHEKTIVVAGSSINSQNFEERTSYSNYGSLPATFNSAAEYSEVDFCAPTNHHVAIDKTTNNGTHWFHNPPINRGVFTTDLIGIVGARPGNTPFESTNTTTLAADVDGDDKNASNLIIDVASSAGFAAGNAIKIMNRAGTVVEYAHILIVGVNTITLRDKLKNSFSAGDDVTVGQATHTDGFSGTSAACPFACGVLALVLSANPKLSFWEARHILKSTAEKIDLRMTPPTGVLDFNLQWTDASAAPKKITDNGGLFNINTAPTLLNFNSFVTALSHAKNPSRSLLTLDSVTNLQSGRSLLIGAESFAKDFPTNNSVEVDNAADFILNQEIIIYGGSITHLALPSPTPYTVVESVALAAIGAHEIMVGNAVGFDIGHNIQIGNTGHPDTEIRRITNIRYIFVGGFGGHLVITLGPTIAVPGPAPLANPHRVNTVVQLANSLTRQINNIAGNILTFSGPAIIPANYPLPPGNPPVIIRE